MALHTEARLLRNRETGVIVHYNPDLAIMPFMELVGEGGDEGGEGQAGNAEDKQPAGAAVLDESTLEEINEAIKATTSVEEVRRIGAESLAIPMSEFDGKKIGQVRVIIRSYIKAARESIEAAE